MFWRTCLILVCLGFLVLAGLWATAYVLSTTAETEGACLALGYGGKEFLISVVVYADGFVAGHHFPANYGHRRGSYVKRSRMGVRQKLTWRGLWPRRITPRRTVATSYAGHLLPPTILLGVAGAAGLSTPVIRRRRRRKRGLCLRCGYDLRGATTEVCSECGYRNVHAGHSPDGLSGESA